MFIKRSSDAIDCINLNLMRGSVLVMYKGGAVYRYTDVSRRAIANLMLNQNMSLGFWVNANCKRDPEVQCSKMYDSIPTFSAV